LLDMSRLPRQSLDLQWVRLAITKYDDDDDDFGSARTRHMRTGG